MPLRNRNRNYENILTDIDKQRKKEKVLNWRDREMFVDTNRGMAVVMGETDNKKALDQRKKKIAKEKMKYGQVAGSGIEEDELTLSWESYYSNVNINDTVYHNNDS